jgi:L-threonylcarbamoyladenylate synthase
VQTEILETGNNGYTRDILKKVAKTLVNGQIVIMPSDTIYGFLAKPDREEQLRECKQRDNKPFLRVISDYKQLSALGVSRYMHRDLIEKNWPGMVSFIFETAESTVGIRMPSWAPLRELLTVTGPLLSTSVNFSGQDPLMDFESIYKQFNNMVSIIIKDTSHNPGKASAVIDITRDPWVVLREGDFKQ